LFIECVDQPKLIAFTQVAFPKSPDRLEPAMPLNECRMRNEISEYISKFSELKQLFGLDANENANCVAGNGVKVGERREPLDPVHVTR